MDTTEERSIFLVKIVGTTNYILQCTDRWNYLCSTKFNQDLKNHSTRASSRWAISCSLDAAMRVCPFSYFWICWNSTPTSAPNAAIDILSSLRRCRIRRPIRRSISLGGVFGKSIPPHRPGKITVFRPERIDVDGCALKAGMPEPAL